MSVEPEAPDGLGGPPAGARASGAAGNDVEIGHRELVGLLAMVTALTALGLDLMLPAFDDMRVDLGLAADSTAITGVVTAYFIGLGVGTLLYGPLSDHRGRRFAIKVGLGIYVAGAVLSVLAPDLPTLLAARAVWGFGAAGPRVVALAVVRDRFEGDEMARTMSSLMAIFILVPILAPGVATGVLVVAPWPTLFALCAVAAIGIMVWVRRLPETLDDAHRIPDLRIGRVRRAAGVVVRTRSTLACTCAVTAMYAMLASYLGSSEAIIDRTFGEADRFPLIFGLLASVMGAGSLLNGRFVRRVGTEGIVRRLLPVYLVAAFVFVAVASATDGTPPLAVFMGIMGVLMGTYAMLLPNLNTLAMAPMAELAGTASSVIGAVQMIVGALLGRLVDSAFDGTITPMAIGFALSSVAVAACLALAGPTGAQAPIAER